MFKKIIIALMLILPVGAFAQKFGHVSSQEIAVLLPDWSKAETEMKDLQKAYADDLQRTEQEIQKKYAEFQADLQKGNVPENIQERRQKEIQDMVTKAQQFQEEAGQAMDRKQQELIQPIFQKVDNAIKEVGQAGGFTYIFDLSRTYIPFINEAQSTDVTAQVKAKLGI
ncbi:OmpH family outer membrane protein [Bacteroides sp. 214]|uniref:OmpH family outer membrane protein n=1 Tax=Bacteroides sp. 214 TaxID=2302935 RepID=UPI0013D2819C|nr:OmpH family outer membrane protein [Bacteroides sp. 214]NDW12589.1 OmpH family outer membrane protein [Bacteroides sp. 214]